MKHLHKDIPLPHNTQCVPKVVEKGMEEVTIEYFPLPHFFFSFSVYVLLV